MTSATTTPRRTSPALRRDDVLVSTRWVAEHAGAPNVRVVEVDVDTTAYDQGHVPGAIGWNWTTQLCDRRIRDIIPKPELEALLGSAGITKSTTVVLYGDNSNWFAAWALWQLKLYGHPDVRLMNGGRAKWIEEKRAMSAVTPVVSTVSYVAGEPNFATRAYRRDVEQVLHAKGVALVDVRSPLEYSGEVLSPPGLAETCQRGGHIPGAVSIPWSRACNDDGTFKSADELRAIYAGAGVTEAKDVITYCRIGERSAHSWFVLSYLLEYPHVRNYDGSWTEWGNLVAAPVEKGMATTK
jgi:thiosulfate/3-mercaptopyruvate sulfurtransferase